jgi:hypothetical protein
MECSIQNITINIQLYKRVASASAQIGDMVVEGFGFLWGFLF